jgi:hypothetical protein
MASLRSGERPAVNPTFKNDLRRFRLLEHI